MKDTAKGYCNCGAVAFEIEGAIRDIYMCHCSICRRWTGHAGVAVVVVPKATFRWVRGQDQIGSWSKPDADWQSSFCKTCGSALPGTNDPSTVFIPAGLIAGGAEKLKVAHHIWVGSKAPWDEINDEAKQHPEAFISS
ncbi:GFA family protein [Gimibacter soli]|uniref:GFA family protein n=1 Tax=Gimibacter soli TaxID=3024400 RepID=A0AAE9XVL8_9PROT|nr:GFA family protein [Gimibacter soli]WCL54738.1 GFA family protein [Gimibacter soli]